MLTLCNRIVPLTIVLALIVGSSVKSDGAAVSAVQNHQPVISEKLRGDLEQVLRNADANQLIPISIVMSHQVSADEWIGFRQLSKQDRRHQVIARLKQVAAESNGPLLAMLQAEQAAGRVGSQLRALWISNVIVTSATPDSIRQVSLRGDVSHINFNQPIETKFIFPIEARPSEIQSPISAGGPIECGVDLMRAPQVWSDFSITGAGVVVCVLDSGCCTIHPDLVNQIWTNPGEIPNNNIDDDNNGFVDDVVGWDFADNDNSPNDVFNHGTHVSGTVGGDGTNGNRTGMAPDVRMMQCKISGSFSAETQVWDSMQYAVENGADVITASLGWPYFANPDRPTWRAVCENTIATGMIVIYAAGNEGGGSPPNNVRCPGDVPDVITIGATDCNRNIAGFSSRGPVTWQSIPPYSDWPYPPGKLKPTVSAPGVNTLSTSNNCSGYATLSGTSMATPHVSGAVALMLQANPNLDHFDVKQILIDTALDQGSPGWDNNYGAGFVDAYDAVVIAMSSGPIPADIGTLAVITGTPVSGGIAEIESSDDRYYTARSGFGRNFVEAHLLQVAVDANTDVPNPTILSVSIESRIDEPSGRLNVYLRNQNSNQLDFVGQFSVTDSDTTIQIPNIDASAYVNGAGDIQMELRYVVFAPFLAFQFDAAIDWIEIAVQ